MDKLVQKLIRKYKTNDPFTIAEGLNIQIRFADLGSCTRGIYYRKLRRKCIFIHEQLDEHWSRFVCAHELGHERLHPGLSRFWLDEHTFFNPGKLERQANTFAVKLLTAGDTLQQGETVSQLCYRNGIPEEMHQYYVFQASSV